MIIQQQIFINTQNYTWCLKEKWIFTVDKTEPEIKLTYPRTHNQWETERELKCMPPESQGLTVVDIHRDFLSIKKQLMISASNYSVEGVCYKFLCVPQGFLC